ncbi:rod shape-determining protein MreC, partial [Patescibacteria group bacterium]|nr:rod shape-determining protein MreC [Patescibacteria group bacterium]
LVGRTERVFAHRSHVLLIIDPNSAIDVQVLRSGARAILVGMMRYAELRPLQYLTRLEYLDGRSDIREDDLMITSGFDGIYPAGLPVGEVKNLKYQTDAIFKSAEIVPMEELSQIKEVLVLQSTSDKEES